MWLNTVEGLIKLPGKHEPIGYTKPCPNCGSKLTYYSAFTQNWGCTECAAFEIPEEYW